MRKTALWSPGIRSLPDKSGMRGFLLSHFIGLAVAVQFLLDRAVTMEIPYNRIVDLPIRLILVWLVIDRVGRQGRMKLTAWDIINLTFIAVQGMFAVYADLYMVRDGGLSNFLGDSMRLLQPYLYFVAVREGLNRRGFKPEVVLYWVVGVIALASVIALFQALNLGGARMYIDDFYRQRQAEAGMEGPSQPWQARGITTHANSMALLLVSGFVALVAVLGSRRLGWIELACGVLFLGTMFATYSRTGIITFICLAAGYAGMLAFQKKYTASIACATGLVALVVLFVGLVETLNIQRYQVFSKGLGVVKNEENRGMWGWYQRQKVMQASVRLMERYPVTGVAAATSSLNRQRIIARNAYTVEGLLLNTFAFAFVSYGINGLFYVFGLLGTCFYQLRYLRTRRAFAMAAVFAGLGLATSGMSETNMFNYLSMIPISCVMALSLTAIPRPKDQKPHVMSWLTDRLVRAN